jgi:hypothetical protein
MNTTLCYWEPPLQRSVLEYGEIAGPNSRIWLLYFDFLALKTLKRFATVDDERSPLLIFH